MVADILIRGDKDVELGLDKFEQLPVLDSAPTEVLDGAGVELRKKLAKEPDRKIFVDKEPVELERVTTVLQAKAKGQEQPGVLLFADRNLPYQNLFEVLDRIRQAGLNRISLQAELDESP